MKINNQNSYINFGTKIKVVSPSDYEILKDVFTQGGKPNNIVERYSLLLEKYDDPRQCYRRNKRRCCTAGVRTCVGISVADTENKKSSFFAHFFHTVRNLNNLPSIAKYIRGTNAVIIGQREDKYDASSEIFDKLLNYCKLKNIPTTVFRGIKTWYEADFAYDAPSDILFMCVSKIKNKHNYVDRIARLRHIFNEVKLAPCDEIEFLKEGSIQYQKRFFTKDRIFIKH